MDSLYHNQSQVDIIVGGSFQSFATISTADVVVVFDALQEIELIPDKSNVIKVPLGSKDTVLSLLTRLSQAQPDVAPLLEEYHQERANVHLGSGMAQDPRIGACAIQDLDLHGELEPIFEEIYIRVMEACNGKLELLVLNLFASTCGGMGAGGASEIGTRFCTYMARYTAAKIRRRTLRIGGLTYLSLSPSRIRDNTEETSKRDLQFMRHGPVSVHELRDLELYELPLRSEAGAPLRDNKEQRNVLATMLAQARYTDCTHRGLSLREVNETPNNGSFGGMLRASASFSRTLDSETIMRAAASAFCQQLRALRRHPDPADMELVQRLEVQLEGGAQVLPPVDDIMALLNQPEGVRSVLLDDCVGAELQVFDATVWVSMSQAQSATLQDILGPSERPASLGDFRRRCQRLRGLLAQLEQACEEAQKEVTARARTLDKQRQVMQHTVGRLRSFWHHLDALVKSPAKLKRGFQVKWEALASAHTRASEATARLEGLNAAEALVARTLEGYETQWLTRLETGLEDMMGKGRIGLDTVEFASLDACYSDLIEAILRASMEKVSHSDDKALAVLRPFLLGLVARVTLQGLAEMLQAPAEPGALITALADQRFAYTSPLWGGASVYVKPRYQYVILPPIAAADFAALERAAAERHYAPSLGVVASAAAGCGIVALDFYPVHKSDEVLTPVYTVGHDAVSQNGTAPTAMVSA